MSMPSRICQQCRAPLAPGQEFCTNCGARYSAPTEPAQPSSPYGGQPQVAPTEYANPYSAPPYGNQGYQAPGTYYGQSQNPYAPPPPPNAQYESAPGAYGQPQVPYGAPGFVQPPPPRKRSNIGLIIGILVLLVLLVGGGIFFLTRPKTTGTTSITPAPGSTFVPGTSEAVPTPGALFSDDFADNSQNWVVGNDNGFSRIITNHALIMTEHNKDRILPEPLPISRNFSDFMMTVTVIFQQGDQNDSVGLYMRGDSNLDHDYRVDIYGDNTYAIAREYLDSNNAPQQQFLVQPASSSAIKPIGQQNTITVVMKGTQLVLLINGTRVNSITDSNYASGQLALYVAHGSSSSGSVAAFNSVAVYPAPAQVP